MYKLSIPISWTTLSASVLLSESNGGVNPAKSPKETFELFSIPGYDSGSSEIAIGKSIGSNKQIVKDGQILLSKINPRISRVWVVKKTTEFRAIASTEWIAFNTLDIIYDKFLKHFLLSEPVRVYLASKVTGSGGSLQRVNKETVSKITIPFPPIKEQKRIVEKIESTQEKIKTIEESVSKAEELICKYRESLLQKAFRGQLVPQDPNDEPASKLIERIRAEKTKQSDSKKKKKDELPPIKPEEIPFEIPKSWEWVRLGDISDVVRGGSPRPAGDKKFYDGDIPFLHVSDLTREPTINVTKFAYTIKPAGLVKTRLVEANTLMLTNSGATLGVPRIVRFKTTFNDGVAAFLGLSNSISKEFLCYYLTTITKQMLKQAYASRSQGQPNLNTGLIANTLVPIPPTKEQNKILSKIENDLERIKILKSSLEEILVRKSDLYTSALNAAFSGTLVPQIPSEGTGYDLLEKIKSEQPQATEDKAAKKASAPAKKKRVKK